MEPPFIITTQPKYQIQGQRVPKAHRVRKVPRVLEETKALRDHLDYRAPLGRLDPPDPQEQLDRKAPPDHREHKANKASRGRLDHKDLWDTMGPLDHKDP